MLLLFALNTLAKSHQSKYQKHNDKSPELGFGRIFLLRLSEFNREKKKKDRFHAGQILKFFPFCCEEMNESLQADDQETGTC